jgi:hypothetical protein
MHDLKHILKIKRQIKIFMIDSDSNEYYVCSKSPFNQVCVDVTGDAYHSAYTL